MTAKDPNKLIQKTAEELLGKLKIKAGVSVEADAEKTYHINLDTEETGLLIGYHGETLNGLQLILGILVYKELGSWVRVVVNVGDYRQKREETVRQIALQAATEVVESGQPKALPYLTPLERRIVHLALVDNPQVSSESEGEGEDRRVIIKLK